MSARPVICRPGSALTPLEFPISLRQRQIGNWFIRKNSIPEPKRFNEKIKSKERKVENILNGSFPALIHSTSSAGPELLRDACMACPGAFRESSVRIRLSPRRIRVRVESERGGWLCSFIQLHPLARASR